MVDPTGELGIPGMFLGAGLDLAGQMFLEGKSWDCVDWWRVGAAGAVGAIGGGFWGGAFRHAKSAKKWGALSHKWGNVSRRVRKAQNTPADKELHHWFFERNSPIGKKVPDYIKNHPWNLSPVSTSFHKNLHRMGPVSRTVAGAPQWAQAAGASAAAGGIGEGLAGGE